MTVSNVLRLRVYIVADQQRYPDPLRPVALIIKGSYLLITLPTLYYRVPHDSTNIYTPTPLIVFRKSGPIF